MSQGPREVFTTSLASAVTSSSAIDLTRSWKATWLEVPTMASGDVFIQGCSTFTGTYRRVASVGATTDFKIGSATTQKIIPLPLAIGGIQYLKVEKSTGCSDVVTTFNIICSD